MRLAAEHAAAMHRSQKVALTGVLAFGALLFFPSLAALIAGWHQVLFWPALIGATCLGVGAWLAVDLARRSSPPSYEVELDDRGIRGTWGGRPTVDIPWSKVRRILPGADGGFVVSAGFRSVSVPGQMPGAAGLLAQARGFRAQAPRPDVETRVTLDEAEAEPVPEGRGAWIRLIDRGRSWVGRAFWLALALCLLGFLDKGLGFAMGGLACSLGGAWWGLSHGLRSWLIGVAVTRSFVVVRTTHRGGMARFMAVMHGILGLCMVGAGGMITLAGLASLIGL